MGSFRGARVLVLATALAIVGSPAVAPAELLFFSDTVFAGFIPAEVAAAGLSPTDSANVTRIVPTTPTTGGTEGLQVTRTSSVPHAIIARPQSNFETPTKTPFNPYIAEVQYDIMALEDLEQAILTIVRPDTSYVSGVNHIGIDVAGQTEILEYNSLVLPDDLLMPSIFLGDMLAGESIRWTFTLYVTAEMEANPAIVGGVVLPSFDMVGFSDLAQVPEPSLLALLLLTGLALLLRQRPLRALPLLAAVGLLVAAPGAAFARDEADVLALRARTLAEGGQCDEATEVMNRTGRTRSAEQSLWLGKCQVTDRNYDAALPYLEAARTGGSMLEAQLFLGIAQYHLGDFDDARANLAAARLGGVDDPQLDLYEGVLLMDSREYEAAAMAFDRARRAGDGSVEPLASFYAAVALRRVGRTGESDAAFARVIDEDPDSLWAARARTASEPVNLLGPPRRWATVTLGGGYDSNIVFKGQDVSLPDQVSGRSALFGAFSAEVGQEVYRASHWQAGIIGRYAASTYNSLKDFNSNAPSIGGWFDYVLNETTAVRARYDYSFMWAGHESFASGHTVDSVLFHEWGETGRSELEAGMYWLDYKYSIPDVNDTCLANAVCGPAGTNEKHDRNRDGYGLVAGLTHVVPLRFRGSHLSGGYRYHRYFSKGNDYSFQGHEVHVGFDAHLPADLEIDVRGSWTYQPYAHPSTYPDPDDVTFGLAYSLSGKSRRDEVLRGDISIARKINARTRIEARYTVIRNASNTDVFDFNRQIFGLYLTTRFQR
ncbi:MAG: PEP-CTERM sorting domain-containing protein [Deltaproteobacteria bacterium]|nr:PEP-CTERM sorting domain-containing protein [Deltaproteobacteria bacterium]MBW2416264.1 PEP-CTERM sorting domain-containing protein [Deltaproteobacteria bacterium]